LSLAVFLYDSVGTETLSDEEIEAEWEAELNRRVKESELGLDVEIPAEEVHRILRESHS
jgi:Putative addiction module component